MKDLSAVGINDEVYNVKAYGAKGDDSTADHVALQAAMDAAWRAGGGQVVVPKGIYRIMQHPMRMRQNVRITLQPGAEIHSYNDASSMFWNGDGSQNRAGWTGHGNLVVDGGVYDMRRSPMTHGCTVQVTGGTDAPAGGTSQSWTVTNNSSSDNRGFPQVPFYIYDPAAPSETMQVTAVTNTTSANLTWQVTRGAKSTSPVTHSAGFAIRNQDMTLASDTFTRSNTSAPHTLGVMDTGQTWFDETSRGTGDQGSGGIGITSNTASAAVAGTNISTVFGWPDGAVSVTIPTVGNAGLVFRVKDSQNYWAYFRHTDGNARLTYYVNGTETVVTPTATQAISNGNTLKVVFYGATVKAYVGTTLTHDTTDSYHTANRKTGILIYDTTARLDAFVSSASLWADDFNRSNSASSLGTASSNIGWTAQSGTLGISSNVAYAPGAGTNISTVPVTQETNVECIMTTTGNAGIVFRYKDTSNYWAYVRHTDGNARLIKVVGGSTTVITPAATQAVAANNILRVTVNGGHIRTYVNQTKTHDTSTTTTWESDHYQEKNAGIIIYDTSARLDRFDTTVAWGGSVSGACFNFGHGENILFRDVTIRDTSAMSHSVEISGCKNVLADNVVFTGMAPVYGRWSEAFQMDITKSNSYFAAFGPHDNTTNRDVIVRGSSFTRSYMPGTTAWMRGVGSHSATVGAWHDHLRVTDNYFDCGEKSIRSYNWNNCFFRGNTISSGTGIEVRVIDPSDTSDTINTAGTQTSASQGIYSAEIEGNIITCDGSTSGSVAAINVTGVTSGHTNGVVIRGNDIRSTTCGGIYVDFSDNCNISNNMINSTAATDSGTHGIRINTCTETVLNGNSLFRIGQNGVYVTGGSTKIRLFNNYVHGANRDNSSRSCFRVDATNTDDITFSGNSTQLWGSGTEPLFGLVVASPATNVRRLQNDFDAGTSGSVSLNGSSDTGNSNYAEVASDLTGLTATSYTDVTGLSIALNTTGLYRFKAHIIWRRTTGSGTFRLGITGPTASLVSYTVTYLTAAGTGTTTTHGASAYLQNTSFVTPGVTNVSYTAVIEGYIKTTATGNLKVQYAGGTTPTMAIWTPSILMVERVTL